MYCDRQRYASIRLHLPVSLLISQTKRYCNGKSCSWMDNQYQLCNSQNTRSIHFFKHRHPERICQYLFNYRCTVSLPIYSSVIQIMIIVMIGWAFHENLTVLGVKRILAHWKMKRSLNPKKSGGKKKISWQEILGMAVVFVKVAWVGERC